MAVRKYISDKKLPMIYNISESIGPFKTNNPDDVQLVQAIFLSFVHKLGIGVVKPYPTLSGQYDAVLGFWIYKLQAMMQVKVDGIVSPLTGNDSKTAGKMWTIYGLNEVMYGYNKSAFDTLPNDNRLRPTLRNALKA